LAIDLSVFTCQKRSRQEKGPPRNSQKDRTKYLLATLPPTNGLRRLSCEKIEATGASTFRDDRDINGGDDIPEEIRRQIKLSKEIVVLLTPDSVDRQWVILEVGAAWGWSKRMRIIILMNHVSVDPIPDMIKK
jgi:hypothetical protein